jgi:hypothetical protein
VVLRGRCAGYAFKPIIIITLVEQVAYIDTEGTYMDILSYSSRRCVVGTFRPDRIRSIADRFGVNGDMALENILYGLPASASSHSWA